MILKLDRGNNIVGSIPIISDAHTRSGYLWFATGDLGNRADGLDTFQVHPGFITLEVRSAESYNNYYTVSDGSINEGEGTQLLILDRNLTLLDSIQFPTTGFDGREIESNEAWPWNVEAGPIVHMISQRDDSLTILLEAAVIGEYSRIRNGTTLLTNNSSLHWIEWDRSKGFDVKSDLPLPFGLDGMAILSATQDAGGMFHVLGVNGGELELNSIMRTSERPPAANSITIFLATFTENWMLVNMSLFGPEHNSSIWSVMAQQLSSFELAMTPDDELLLFTAVCWPERRGLFDRAAYGGCSEQEIHPDRWWSSSVGFFILPRDADDIHPSNDLCPDLTDPNQLDSDGDGIGDLCDDDIDGDGVLNVDDHCPRDRIFSKGGGRPGCPLSAPPPEEIEETGSEEHEETPNRPDTPGAVIPSKDDVIPEENDSEMRRTDQPQTPPLGLSFLAMFGSLISLVIISALKRPRQQ